MIARWGEFVYRIAAMLAGIIAVLAVLNYVYDANRGEPIIPIIPVLLAGVIWLIGHACRHLAAEIHLPHSN